MITAGIIAEFNPFHNGHAHLIREARAFGAERVICLMSGDFVQRGEPAVANRYVRAEMALRGGADLVLSLPCRWASSSAESFAAHGVRILDSLGIVDLLVFGSECGDVRTILDCAGALSEETEEYKALLQRGLREGMSFPAARAAALPQFSSLLKTPNNILGVEYCKALLRMNSSMRPVTFRRVGGAHNSREIERKIGAESFASAGAIRDLLENKKTENKKTKDPLSDAVTDNVLAEDFPEKKLLSVMPGEAFDILKWHLRKNQIVTAENLLPLLIARLWRSDAADDLMQFMDVTKDLAGTLLRERTEMSSWRELVRRCAGKSLTESHVSRALLHLAIDIKKKENCKEEALLTQALGVRRESADLLSELKQSSKVPVIVNPARECSMLNEEQRQLLMEETRLANLYEALQAASSGRRARHCWSQQLIKT